MVSIDQAFDRFDDAIAGLIYEAWFVLRLALPNYLVLIIVIVNLILTKK